MVLSFSQCVIKYLRQFVVHLIHGPDYVCLTQTLDSRPSLDSDSQLRNVRSLELPSLLHTAGHHQRGARGRFLPHRMTSWYRSQWANKTLTPYSTFIRNAFLFDRHSLFAWVWDSWIIHWLYYGHLTFSIMVVFVPFRNDSQCSLKLFSYCH